MSVQQKLLIKSRVTPAVGGPEVWELCSKYIGTCLYESGEDVETSLKIWEGILRRSTVVICCKIGVQELLFVCEKRRKTNRGKFSDELFSDESLVHVTTFVYRTTTCCAARVFPAGDTDREPATDSSLAGLLLRS